MHVLPVDVCVCVFFFEGMHKMVVVLLVFL